MSAHGIFPFVLKGSEEFSFPNTSSLLRRSTKGLRVTDNREDSEKEEADEFVKAPKGEVGDRVLPDGDNPFTMLLGSASWQ